MIKPSSKQYGVQRRVNGVWFWLDDELKAVKDTAKAKRLSYKQAKMLANKLGKETRTLHCFMELKG